jgi:hypothetical protein
MNTLLWGDGTGDAKALAGIRALITANPTTGTIGGIDRATNEYLVAQPGLHHGHGHRGDGHAQLVQVGRRTRSRLRPPTAAR